MPQGNALQWEWADPLWEMPAYISAFAWDLQETKAWIMSSGAVEPAKAAPLTNPQLLTASNGKSEVRASDEDQPSP